MTGRQIVAAVLLAPAVLWLYAATTVDYMSTHQALIGLAVAVGVIFIPDQIPAVLFLYLVGLFAVVGFDNEALSAAIRTDVGGELVPNPESGTPSLGRFGTGGTLAVVGLGGGALLTFVALRFPWTLPVAMVALSFWLGLEALDTLGHDTAPITNAIAIN